MIPLAMSIQMPPTWEGYENSEQRTQNSRHFLDEPREASRHLLLVTRSREALRTDPYYSAASTLTHMCHVFQICKKSTSNQNS